MKHKKRQDLTDVLELWGRISLTHETWEVLTDHTIPDDKSLLAALETSLASNEEAPHGIPVTPHVLWAMLNPGFSRTSRNLIATTLLGSWGSDRREALAGEAFIGVEFFGGDGELMIASYQQALEELAVKGILYRDWEIDGEIPSLLIGINPDWTEWQLSCHEQASLNRFLLPLAEL